MPAEESDRKKKKAGSKPCQGVQDRLQRPRGRVSAKEATSSEGLKRRGGKELSSSHREKELAASRIGPAEPEICRKPDRFGLKTRLHCEADNERIERMRKVTACQVEVRQEREGTRERDDHERRKEKSENQPSQKT